MKSDLSDIESEHPWYIGADYAKSQDRLILCDLDRQRVTTPKGEDLLVADQNVLVRATCPVAEPALSLMECLGARLVETLSDFRAIEDWPCLGLTKRPVLTVASGELFTCALRQPVSELLHAHPNVFVKSKKKGFSAQFPAKRLLEQDVELLHTLEPFAQTGDESWLVSPYFPMSRDSLGPKEARFFVLNGKIANGSRPIRGLRHNVPQSLCLAAEKIVHRLRKMSFPAYYVLDMGEFLVDGHPVQDVVELNPITSALCYVQNSLFPRYAEYGAFLGTEFAWDAMRRPEAYSNSRVPGVVYSLTSPLHYDFIGE